LSFAPAAGVVEAALSESFVEEAAAMVTESVELVNEPLLT
jgi:hypothetical protein